jgi:hypothetical protein
MVVAGQPKTTAEYIQATSRVGRRLPGLVLTVYNWARPRDLSHYERFEHYHATFYERVEALSVTPFAERALDRGLSALLVALIRLHGQEFNANKAAGSLTRDHPAVQRAISAIRARVGYIQGSDLAERVKGMLDSRLEQWLNLVNRGGGIDLGYRAERDGVTRALLSYPQPGHWDMFTCLNSLRDVEPMAGLILVDDGLGHSTEDGTTST